MCTFRLIVVVVVVTVWIALVSFEHVAAWSVESSSIVQTLARSHQQPSQQKHEVHAWHARTVPSFVEEVAVVEEKQKEDVKSAVASAFTVDAVVPVEEMLEFVGTQYTRVYQHWLNNTQDYPDWAHPTDEEWQPTTPVKPFIAGFYGGILWYLYANSALQQNASAQYLDWAQQVQVGNAPVANVTWTHDVGFVIMSTYGLGYRLTQNDTYLPVIHQAALSLSTRYSPIVRCTRSWNNDTDFWVIIDNMMNLELLFWAGQYFGNKTWTDMAWNHANRTMFEHFREDNSTYHVVEYNDTTGAVVRKHTNQGYADWSTWARGQAWSIYGFTAAYRFTQYRPFLDKAVGAAELFLRRLRNEVDDFVPYWDFDAPFNTTWEPRDSSAAAITASGLLELVQYVNGTNSTQAQELFDSATSILSSLSSYNYSIRGHDEYPLPGLLAHATGNYPQHSQIDVALCYGEYYYTEALYRLALINAGKAVVDVPLRASPYVPSEVVPAVEKAEVVMAANDDDVLMLA